MNYITCEQVQKFCEHFDSYEFFDLNKNFLLRCKPDEDDVLFYCTELCILMKRRLSFEKTTDGYLDIIFHDEKYDIDYDTYEPSEPVDLLECIKNYFDLNARLIWLDFSLNKKWKYVTVDYNQVLAHTHKPHFNEENNVWEKHELSLDDAFGSFQPDTFEISRKGFNVQDMFELLEYYDVRYILFERGRN